jgi:ribose-phosphate pyrophosphokinase
MSTAPADPQNVRVLALPGADACAARIAARLGATCCRLETRRFPDGEIYLRVLDDVAGRDLVAVAQLRDPDPQLAGLIFVADALRELGAASVGLVAPYLPYMRQDTRFRPGEAVTSQSFARLVSSAFSWLVTVDPHLHRHASLGALYGIPAEVVPSAPAIAAWVQTQVTRPYLVGPDEESAQWVAAVAALAGCPYTVLRKLRRGDRDVRLVLPDLGALQGHVPVLVDDIVSSAHTLAEAVRALRATGLAAPVCIGIHPVFAGDAEVLLRAAGAARIVSCNTLAHPSNGIDVSGAIAEAVRVRLEGLHLGSPDLPAPGAS